MIKLRCFKIPKNEFKVSDYFRENQSSLKTTGYRYRCYGNPCCLETSENPTIYKYY